MVHRGIATIAMALGTCFLLLSHFDSQFFLVHFYESLIYLAIVLMLFYFEDRWAYMMGIVAPAAWLLLTMAWTGLRGFGGQLLLALHPANPSFPTGLLTALTLVFSVALAASCANRWRVEFSGQHKGWSTFAVSLAIVVVYYAVLVVWVLRWPPAAA